MIKKRTLKLSLFRQKTIKLKSRLTVPAVQSFQSSFHNFLRFAFLLHEGAVTNRAEMQQITGIQSFSK